MAKNFKHFFPHLQQLPQDQNVPHAAKSGGGKGFTGKLIFFGALVIIAFLVVHITVPRERFHAKSDKLVSNVHFVDSAGSNFLFRGGLPLIRKQQEFNYDGLKKAIAAAGNTAGINVPQDFFIVDVNLLNVENTEDRERIYVEHQFFKTHPNLGLIQVWGMVGTGLSAADPALAASRDYLGFNLDSWLSDRLGQRIELVRQWLLGAKPESMVATNLPVVIYVHCVAGCDRTGEFIGAYYLRYMRKSWQEMNALNQSMCHHNRPFKCRNYRANQWYCLWLNQKYGFTLNWQQEFPCSGQ